MDVDLSVAALWQLFHSHVAVLSLFLCSLGELKSSITPWTQTLWESTSWTISLRRNRIFGLTCKLFPLMLTHRNLPDSPMCCPSPGFLLSLCLFVSPSPSVSFSVIIDAASLLTVMCKGLDQWKGDKYFRWVLSSIFTQRFKSKRVARDPRWFTMCSSLPCTRLSISLSFTTLNGVCWVEKRPLQCRLHLIGEFRVPSARNLSLLCQLLLIPMQIFTEPTSCASEQEFKCSLTVIWFRVKCIISSPVVKCNWKNNTPSIFYCLDKIIMATGCKFKFWFVKVTMQRN